MLKDRFGRIINYLRISITRNCNLKCIYCFSGNLGNEFNSIILKDQEIVRLAKIAISLGIKKIRLTGGEPLMRKGIEKIIKELVSISGLDDLSLTTNGVLLEKYADSLKEAGLKRINISLDTLDEKKFKKITNTNCFKKVMEGIKIAKKIGFAPIKINVVVIRGINDDELENFINFGKENNFVIRFVEYMPIYDKGSFSSIFVSREEILKRIQHLIENDSLTVVSLDDPYQYIPIKNGNRIGIISSVSHGFCDRCNRLRITSDGFLRSCLTQDIEIDLKEALRKGAEDPEIEMLFKKAVILKPEKGCFFSRNSKRDMSQIGG